MEAGLRITVVDVEVDYLGIVVTAANGAFSGAARIYAEIDELSTLARAIAGFPTTAVDRRSFELGARDARWAGGFVGLTLHCRDGLGHAVAAVEIRDDEASAELSF